MWEPGAMKENEDLIHDSKLIVQDLIEDMRADKLRDWSYIKNEIRHRLKDFLYQKTKRTPMILPMIIEI